MHLNEQTLRAFLDGELEPGRMAEAEAHLRQCESCRGELERIHARATYVASSLGASEGPKTDSPEAAFARLRPRLAEPSGGRASTLGRRLRVAWAPTALVIALAVALSVPSVRVWAGEFLGLFRVQHVTVLPVDITRLSALSQDQPLTTQLSQLLSSSVTMTRKAGDPQAADDPAQASQMAGFDLRLPTNRTDTPMLLVQSGEAFDIRIDRERAQSLIEAAGFAGLQLPQSIDGATISVDIPTGVTAGYGDCPALKEAVSEGPDATGSLGRQYANCIMVAEIPSPTISTPPDLDIEQLAEIGLQFTGMTAEQAHQYSQTVDWTSTLVIPIPRNGASYEKVAVDGVTGYLIQRPTDDAPQYALIWVKDGIIYAIGGLGNNAQEALDMADSMP
jgi:predicted anti-sigma-YlaC factor YlaD